jgi:hypothetical protein
MDVDDWIRKWQSDILQDDVISNSIQTFRREMELCNSTRKAASRLAMGIVSGNPEVPIKDYRLMYEQCSAFFLYHWEAMVGHLRSSLLLALAGSYNAAFSLLRNSTELLVKGAFYDCLAHREYREAKWGISVESGESQLQEYLVRKLREDSASAWDLEVNSGGIFPLIGDWLYENDLLKFRNIVTLLIKWKLFRPMDDLEASKELNRIYSRLSDNVHEYPDRTDFGRTIMEHHSFEFEPRVLSESLGEFLVAWRQTFDIATVLAINIVRNRRDDYVTKELLLSLVDDHDYAISDLPLTKRWIQWFSSEAL